MEKSSLKIFGAGLLSSASEIEHVMQGVKDGNVCVKAFSINDAVTTPCIVTSFQKRYFFTETILKAQEQLRSCRERIRWPETNIFLTTGT